LLVTTVLRMLAGGIGLLCAAASLAAETQVAVAANFTAPMRQIATLFERESGHKAVLAFGSTGAFQAQIRNGAPFDVLLAADSATPTRLEADGLAVPGSRFTYAVGRLAVWSALADGVDSRGDVLRSGRLDRLAIANPKLAPYGAAAVQALERLGLAAALRGKWVQGENIAQTYQFVASGNVPVGFVALSQVYAQGRLQSGSAWVVPETLHDPIRQDAALLVHGSTNPAAAALLRFLRGAAARRVIAEHGYGF
jgi:molybdate transport system substrate-binding protein